MRNEKGFSLIEATIILTLFGIATLVVSQFMEQVEVRKEELSDLIESKIEKRLASIIMDKDIYGTFISFNQIFRKSENSKNKNFFLYSCERNQRTFILGPDHEKEIFFLTKKDKNMPIKCHGNIKGTWHYCNRLQKNLIGIYDPMNAFTYQEAINLDYTPPLKYHAANLLKNTSGNFIRNTPVITSRGTLLAFIVPYDAANNCRNPKPYPVFIGYTDKPKYGTTNPIDIKHISQAMPPNLYERVFPTSKEIFPYGQPNYLGKNSSEYRSGMERFFKSIPSIGGNSPLVFIMPVQLVHYYIEKKEDTKGMRDDTYNVYREVIRSIPPIEPNQVTLRLSSLPLQGRATLIYENIDKVVFKRPALNSQVIQVKPYYKSRRTAAAK